ncbi:A/G-specific adenine glycosylase [Dyella sp.]|jgi:A/G-specific adenine glycosylase|uniref:A/G-specific adenine glycosylase n=1 Tax=Dyella sp. TaxID=1869338 RepID=UPI002D7885DA|nr:A/G-specific adenine glycosylase [Dyella sp.]HET6433649.1 A/G-specific adenine glycosylase [Dyella sp.]
MNEPFAERLLHWFDQHGRRNLPWQLHGADGRRDAYRVWLSEVMLQQTQVATVIPYFQRFTTTLPTLADLARADEDSVLALWSGLGYYRRARFLHQAAKRCLAEHDGALPRDIDALRSLPGIGRSTAGAILAQAHGERFAILDGNVKRVLTRYHGIHGDPAQAAVEKQLWQLAESQLPSARLADYTQAIMDLGATVCTRAQPACSDCPVRRGCVAHRDGLTDQLPATRPGKRIPTRQTVMLVLRDSQGRVLLERRGPQGVWSGLWSLPEASDRDAGWRRAAEFARLEDVHALPPFTHVFSHYKLAVEPLLYDDVAPLSAIADRPDLRWSDASQREAMGLPAPVRVLLNQL